MGGVSHLRNEMAANRLPNTVSVLGPSFRFIIKIMTAQSNHVRLDGKPACAQLPDHKSELGRGGQVLAYGLRLNTFRYYVQHRRANQIQ